MPNDAASSVVLKFAEDATLEVLISGIDYGQGLMTVAAQFAAEALDIPVETIRVKGCPDTDLSPYDWQTVASRQTWATGNAIFRAADRLKEQLFECGSADSYNVCEWASIDRLERVLVIVPDTTRTAPVPLMALATGPCTPTARPPSAPTNTVTNVSIIPLASLFL